MTDRPTEDEFLKRMDMNIRNIHDKNQMKKELMDNWLHAYDPTQKQVDALWNATQRRPEYEPVELRSGRAKKWTQTPTGKRIPRLASVGIRRKTFYTRGRRQTRYIVPGRAGLFGLSTARQIFGQL